jgi:hypothetical protein
MSVLTLAGGLCSAWLIYYIVCWCWCLEIGTSSFEWAPLTTLSPESGNRIQSPKCYVFYIRKRTIMSRNTTIVPNHNTSHPARQSPSKITEFVLLHTQWFKSHCLTLPKRNTFHEISFFLMRKIRFWKFLGGSV